MEEHDRATFRSWRLSIPFLEIHPLRRRTAPSPPHISRGAVSCPSAYASALNRPALLEARQRACGVLQQGLEATG